jgi:hypothetical protein
MYQTIVVPINGASRSEMAIRGMALTRSSGAALDLVRVYTHDRRLARRPRSLTPGRTVRLTLGDEHAL